MSQKPAEDTEGNKVVESLKKYFLTTKIKEQTSKF